MVGRILGVNDDRAADGVAAVERALGSFEDLDLLDIVQFLVELVRIGLENAVNQDRDRRLAIARL